MIIYWQFYYKSASTIFPVFSFDCSTGAVYDSFHKCQAKAVSLGFMGTIHLIKLIKYSGFCIIRDSRSLVFQNKLHRIIFMP